MRIRWLGEGPRVVETPVPLLSRSEKTGEVLCDPIGDFNEEDGRALVEIGGLFEAVDKADAKPAPQEPDDEWDENGPASARLPLDRPVTAYRAKGVAYASAKRRGLEVRENPGSEKPWELWAPSPATEGATERSAISA